MSRRGVPAVVSVDSPLEHTPTDDDASPQTHRPWELTARGERERVRLADAEQPGRRRYVDRERLRNLYGH